MEHIPDQPTACNIELLLKCLLQPLFQIHNTILIEIVPVKILDQQKVGNTEGLPGFIFFREILN